LLRRPEKSSAEPTTDWMTDTFWSITTERGGAFMMRPTTSPTSTGALHQPSAQARTPRDAHWSANAFSLSRAAAGIAPRLWFTR
jgi:hypothetical protein